VINHSAQRRSAVASGDEYFSRLGLIRVIVELFAYVANIQHQFAIMLINLLKREYW
jgi:hypothetical protein